MKKLPDVVRAGDISQWDDTADVVIAGFGIAGASAALEAHRAGADVLMIERASGAGGTSMLSSGIFYLGGGTPVQQACGFEDSVENMYRFLMASTGITDPEIIRAFCDNSVEHFNWLEAQGVPFERTAFIGTAVALTTTQCLMSTGNEKIWPYRDIVPATPRGHKVARESETAGALAMEHILARCAEAGFRTLYDTGVTALVTDDNGRVVGVAVRQSKTTKHIRARKAVILATGGFSMNPDMLKEYVPYLTEAALPLGVPHNDGSGIELGCSVGAAIDAMDGTIASGSFYPPTDLLKGILVNARGERFLSEDSYHGRTAAFVAEQPGHKAYLIVDSDIFAYPEIGAHQHTLIDGWDTIADMEAGLKLPAGTLQRTMAEYNRHAAEGRDPQFYKHPDWVKPLTAAPYAAFDVSFDKSVYFFLTLGGLKTNARAEVLTADGQAIPGLYAAGSCAASFTRDGKGYASGLSLAPNSFFGRVAGRMAAEQEA